MQSTGLDVRLVPGQEEGKGRNVHEAQVSGLGN